MDKITLKFYKFVILILLELFSKVVRSSKVEDFLELADEIVQEIDEYGKSLPEIPGIKIPEKKHPFLIKHGAGGWLDIHADLGKKELFERIPGVREVFDGAGKRNEYTVFLDPRFDKQEVADTIELLLNLGF